MIDTIEQTIARLEARIPAVVPENEEIQRILGLLDQCQELPVIAAKGILIAAYYEGVNDAINASAKRPNACHDGHHRAYWDGVSAQQAAIVKLIPQPQVGPGENV